MTAEDWAALEAHPRVTIASDGSFVLSAPETNVDFLVKLIEDPDACGPQWRTLAIALRKAAAEIALAAADIVARFDAIVEGLELAPVDADECGVCLGAGEVVENGDQVNPALYDYRRCGACDGTGVRL